MFIDLFTKMSQLIKRHKISQKKNAKGFELIFINVYFAILTGGGKMGLLHAKTTT